MRQRLSRHQLIKRIRLDNPDMTYMSDEFRECIVMFAYLQENTSDLVALANFTGMSKGEVHRHLIKIGSKADEAATAKETVETSNAERQDVGSPTNDDPSADVVHGDVPPFGA